MNSSISPVPVADAGADITICPGGSTSIGNVAVGGKPPYIYLWSNGNTNATQSVNPNTQITYFVTVTDANGCTDSDAITISIFVVPGCGSSITDSRDGNTYSTKKIGCQCWMKENLAYLPSVSPSANGSATLPHYYVYGYEGFSVATAKGTGNYQTYGVLYNWPAAMAGGASSNSVPSGVQGVCPKDWHLPSNAEWDILSNYLGGESVAGGKMKETGNLHWAVPNTGADNSSGFTALPGGMRYSNGSFLDLWYGTGYWSALESINLRAKYRYLHYSSTECAEGHEYMEHGFSVRCIADYYLSSDAGPDKDICQGFSTSIGNGAIGGMPPYSFLWSNGSVEVKPSVSPSVTTTYTVTVTDAYNNIHSDDVTITVIPAPTINAGLDQTICKGSIISIGNTATGGVSPYNYLWNNGCTDAVNMVSPTITTAYRVTVTDANSCTGSDETVVSVNPVPTVIASADDTICRGESTTINVQASGGAPPYTYNWSNGNTDVSFSVSPSITTTYTVTVTDLNGCSESDYVIILVSLPLADAGADITICPGASTSIGNIATGGISPYSYVWNNGNSNISQTVGPTSETTYTVSVTDSYGCSDSDEITVTIFIFPGCGNSFTDSRDNTTYNTVQIGCQCWMQENLAYLPSVSPSNIGSNFSPYYYVYGYDGTNVSDAKAYVTYLTYGVLYNWPAAMAGEASSNSEPSGVQGVCPESWHLPSEAEWHTLIHDYLGGAGVAGGKMKETGTSHWVYPNEAATNSSDFTALPGGYRNNAPSMHYYFGYMAYYGVFWSSTETSGATKAWYSILYNDFATANQAAREKEIGYSVRCLKDN